MKSCKIRESNYIIYEDGSLETPKGTSLSTWEESNSGYSLFRVRVENKPKCYRLHRILAECFLPNPDNLPFVKHKDDDRSNNTLNNLEWGANRDNVQEGYDNGCYKFKTRSYPIKATHKITGKETTFKSLRSLTEGIGCNRKSVAAILNDKKNNNYDYYFEYLL